MDQTGSYAATAYNEDAEEEVLFTLEIKGQTGREMDNSTDMQLTGYLCVFVCVCVCVFVFSAPKNHIPVGGQE